MVPEPVIRLIYPTNYFRYERRDSSCPNLTLQQWWADCESTKELLYPEACKWGEWRDVPIVQEPAGLKTFTSIQQQSAP
jgi:hypothetical protein